MYYINTIISAFSHMDADGGPETVQPLGVALPVILADLSF